MSINSEFVELDKCYRTETGQVRLVTKIEGDDITFSSRGPSHFLDWHDTAARIVMSRQRFAQEAIREVPYYWEGDKSRSDLISPRPENESENVGFHQIDR
jgi:hypothetical protein